MSAVGGFTLILLAFSILMTTCRHVLSFPDKIKVGKDCYI